MDFSFSAIMAGFVFGVIGIYLFRWGRKNTNFYLVGIGVVLMFYSYFVDNALLNWAIGFGLCSLAYTLRDS